MVKKLEKGSNRTSSILQPKKQGKNHKAQEIKKKSLITYNASSAQRWGTMHQCAHLISKTTKKGKES
jgi:hypothetical protein